MPESRRSLRLPQIVLLVVVGFVAAFFVALLIGVLLTRRTTPALTEQHLTTAMTRWREQDLSDYDLKLQLAGRRSDVMQIEVRGGTTVSFSINDQKLAGSRIRDTWMVVSQFDYMQRDLEAAAADPGRLVLRARFDPAFGYPLSYQRIDLTGRLETGWEVHEFRPARQDLDPSAAADR